MRWRAALVAVSLALLLLGCIVIHDSPAPGCVKRLGVAPLGGCQGKTIITGLHLQPQPTCLTLEVNNCNGGVVEATNSCTRSVQLDDLILPAATTLTFDVVPQEDGYVLTETAGNIARTIPTHDLVLTFTGRLGSVPITLTLTKTAPLCP